MAVESLEKYFIDQETARQTAEDLRKGAQDIIDKLEEIKAEMAKIDNQDEAIYFNSDSNKKPGAFKAELDANAGRFQLFKDQIDAFATYLEGQVEQSDQL